MRFKKDEATGQWVPLSAALQGIDPRMLRRGGAGISEMLNGLGAGYTVNPASVSQASQLVNSVISAVRGAAAQLDVPTRSQPTPPPPPPSQCQNTNGPVSGQDCCTSDGGRTYRRCPPSLARKPMESAPAEAHKAMSTTYGVMKPQVCSEDRECPVHAPFCNNGRCSATQPRPLPSGQYAMAIAGLLVPEDE